MPIPDDPFAHDPERTVIRPMPGRRSEPAAAPGRKPAPPPAPPPAGPSGSEDVAEIGAVGVNPLVEAASSLIAMAVRLRHTTNQSDVPALRDRIVRELKRFEQALRARNVEEGTIRTAHFALCALIDDLVLKTPWGHQSNWRAQTLTGVFHNDVRAGERFFDPILKRLRANPGPNIDLIELMYLCVSLGFEGMYRGAENGPAEIARLREAVYAEIRRCRGDFERELSPHWQGIAAAHKPLASQIPLWVFALASGAVLTAVFIGFVFALGNLSEPVFAQIPRLPPGKNVPVQGATALPVLTNHAPRLREFLAKEIQQGLVEVKDDERTITILIHGSRTFASGSATLQSEYRSVVERIGTALQNEPGRIIVSGHTDNTPVRASGAFPSNAVLSEKRAEAAQAIIQAQLMTDKDRVEAEGMGDTQPLFANDTPEHREQNRRIEIMIFKPVAG